MEHNPRTSRNETWESPLSLIPDPSESQRTGNPCVVRSVVWVPTVVLRTTETGWVWGGTGTAEATTTTPCVTPTVASLSSVTHARTGDPRSKRTTDPVKPCARGHTTSNRRGTHPSPTNHPRSVGVNLSSPGPTPSTLEWTDTCNQSDPTRPRSPVGLSTVLVTKPGIPLSSLILTGSPVRLPPVRPR